MYWLHRNLDRVIREVIINYGSEMTQTKVSVGDVKIDMVNGRCVIKNFILPNPKGFEASDAIKINEFILEIVPSTLKNQIVEIEKIEIISPDIVYENSEKTSNFDVLQQNISTYLGPAKLKSPDDKKLIVHHLSITNGKVKAVAAFMNGQSVDFDLPDVHLTELGKAENGLSPGQLGQVIVSVLKKQLISTINFTKLARELLGTAGELAGSVQETSTEVVNKLKSLF